MHGRVCACVRDFQVPSRWERRVSDIGTILRFTSNSKYENIKMEVEMRLGRLRNKEENLISRVWILISGNRGYRSTLAYARYEPSLYGGKSPSTKDFAEPRVWTLQKGFLLRISGTESSYVRFRGTVVPPCTVHACQFRRSRFQDTSNALTINNLLKARSFRSKEKFPPGSVS